MVLHYFVTEGEGNISFPIPRNVVGELKEAFARKLVDKYYNFWCTDNTATPEELERRKERKILSVHSVNIKDLNTRKMLFKW